MLIPIVVAYSLFVAGPAAAAGNGADSDVPVSSQASERSPSCGGFGIKWVIYMVIYMVRYGESATAPEVKEDCPAGISA